MASAVIACSSSGNNEIVAAAGSGRKIRVHSYVVVVTAAVDFKWRSANTDLTGAMSCAADGDGVASADAPDGLFETAANEALNLNLSGATAVAGHVRYSLAP
jgi:hypothetical protein